jgi:hypothetical protein
MWVVQLKTKRYAQRTENNFYYIRVSWRYVGYEIVKKYASKNVSFLLAPLTYGICIGRCHVSKVFSKQKYYISLPVLPYFVIDKLGHLTGVPGLFMACLFSGALR